jgi:hypothetical protein
MREIFPGHSYLLSSYPAKEDTTDVYLKQRIDFRKRIGENYPGNIGDSHNGTSTQELLRVIIARSQYVNNQESHQANIKLIKNCRESILDLEKRAAIRRGDEYFRSWYEKYFNSLENNIQPENIPPCNICGHIFCSKHENESKS